MSDADDTFLRLLLSAAARGDSKAAAKLICGDKIAAVAQFAMQFFDHREVAAMLIATAAVVLVRERGHTKDEARAILHEIVDTPWTAEEKAAAQEQQK